MEPILIATDSPQSFLSLPACRNQAKIQEVAFTSVPVGKSRGGKQEFLHHSEGSIFDASIEINKKPYTIVRRHLPTFGWNGKLNSCHPAA